MVDAGPLAAAIDADDPDHEWSVSLLRRLPGLFLTTEAAITEAVHVLENRPAAIAALKHLVGRMTVVPLAPAKVVDVLGEVERWAPRMDYADACAVLLVRTHARAFVLTTDHRDFAAYRVPFASPEGEFFGC